MRNINLHNFENWFKIKDEKNLHFVFTQWREKVIEMHFSINTKLQFWIDTNTPNGNKSLYFIFLHALGALILENRIEISLKFYFIFLFQISFKMEDGRSKATL